MPDEEEHQPGDRAPATAHYEELNVFGTPTGAVSRFVKETGFHLHRGALRGGRYGGVLSSVSTHYRWDAARMLRSHYAAKSSPAEQ
jgi:hypothetical protein